MSGPLLETKLHRPRQRRAAVARPRLRERLSRGSESALTLLSAPAGFGKTTLLAEWLATASDDGRAVAWVSLDDRDNDPVLFWSYVATSLNGVAPEVGGAALSLLQSPQPSIASVLDTLLNDLDTVQGDLVLVLDDFHLIEARDVQDGMGFLLDHLPPQVHLVIAGRADPSLPLALLRGRGELVEIRAADLRFTPDESSAYLTDAMGLVLTAPEVATLEGRTEGWIAALQLAALSLKDREDVAGFIAGFAGDDRYIVDYLAEEVLQRQPADVQLFLLRTSILDRLTGPLCDAVTGQEGGKARLTALERENLFLVPLDDRRRWYRYHQLFADVLHAHLLDEQAESVPDLHLRASGWYEQNGQPAEAIRHALTAADFSRAADLIERAIPAMRRDRQETLLRSWIAQLPDEAVRTRPVLSVGFAGALLAVGELESVEGRLQDAERLMDGLQHGSATGEPIDDAEFRRLPGTIQLFRAAQALARGDLQGTVRHGNRAIDLSAVDDHLSQAAALGLLGLAYWASGDLTAGYTAYAGCMAGLYRAGHVSDTFGCAIALADIRLTQGRPGAAMRIYQEALQQGAEKDKSASRGTADMYVGMSEVLREHDDLPGASRMLLRSRQLGEHNGLPQNRYRWRVAMARLRVAEGDAAAALDLLDEAERAYVSDFFPPVRPVPAVRARLWIAQGRLDDASGWATERGLSHDDTLNYLTEFEHVTLARLLVAQSVTAPTATDAGPQAGRLLQALREAAEAGGRTGIVIEVLVLQALLLAGQSDAPTALTTLQQALTLAEPEDYVRIFADEGPPMAALLGTLTEQGSGSGYIRRLIAACARPTDDPAVGPALATEPPSTRPAHLLAPTHPTAPTHRAEPDRLIEPLSARELEVLRLLGTDLDGPRIARELFVSLNTVRTHTKNIFSKLGVNNRRAAVRRGAELGLLSRIGPVETRPAGRET